MSDWTERYEAMPHADWADIHDLARRTYGIREPWPKSLAGHHLRWLAGERFLGRIKSARDFPTAAALGQEWNWPKWKASEFITGGEWQDPERPIDMIWLRGERLIGVNKKPTADRRQTDGRPTAETGERRESTLNPDGGPTAGRRQADAARENHPRASTLSEIKIPPTPRGGRPLAGLTPQEPSHDRSADPDLGPDPAPGPADDAGCRGAPPDHEPRVESPGAPAPGGDRGRPAAPALRSPPDEPGPGPGRSALNADIAMVWGVYRGYHPRGGPTPPKALARILRGALAEHTAEDVARVIAWAHEAPDRSAAYLREQDYLGLNNLLVASKLDARIEAAARWRPPDPDPDRPSPTQVRPPNLPASVAADLDFLRAWLPTGTANRPPIWSQHPDRETARRVATAVIAAGRWAPLYAALDHHLPRVAEALLRDPHHAPHLHQEAAK